LALYYFTVRKKRKTDMAIMKEFFFKSFNTDVTVKFVEAIDFLSPCQEDTYSEICLKIDTIFESLKDSIFIYYKSVYPDYIEAASVYELSPDSEIVRDVMPIPTNAENLVSHYIPTRIYIPKNSECKPGSFGLYFHCSWDINKGVGVRIKDWHVEYVGYAEVAFGF
jgi:hypothetical protein